MHRAIAHTLSALRTEWASWSSLWSFLTHLNDLDFYKGLDEQREICIAPSGNNSRGITYTSRGHTTKILLLISAHNSLSQRILIELTERGHQVSVIWALHEFPTSGQPVTKSSPTVTKSPRRLSVV